MSWGRFWVWVALAILSCPGPADPVEGGPDGQEVERNVFMRAGNRRLVGKCVGSLVPFDPGVPRHTL